MNRTDSKIKFVGLHAHSVAGSIFDAIGYPQAHMDFCYENGAEKMLPLCTSRLKSNVRRDGLVERVPPLRRLF